MNRMLWLDMEMTGLLPHRDRVLEVAAIVTSLDFEILTSYETAVFQSPEVLANMDPWCIEQHGKSGLTERVASGASETSVEDALCRICDEFFASEKAVLCGNSIGQDRKFVESYFPKFASRLHYRMLDVSSFKLVFENLYHRKFPKQNRHRALGDIEESIAELQYYLKFISVGTADQD